MPPETIAAYAAIITSIGTLLGGGWAYLYQRAQLREEREKRKALETSTARKDEFEHQQTLIETLQRAMEAQNTRHERERAEWHDERAELTKAMAGQNARHERERVEWQNTIHAMQNEIDELRGRPKRNRSTGPLGV